MEDFNFVKTEFGTRTRPRSNPRRSALLLLISGPRTETFRQIGGHDFEATTAPPAAVTRSRTISTVPSPLPLPSPARSAYIPVSPAMSTGMFSATPNASPAPITPYSARSQVLLPPAPTLSIDTRSVSTGDYGQRVIVRYRHGRAPTLDLRRFSDLDLLPEQSSAAAIEEGRSPHLKAQTLPINMYYPESVFTPATASSYSFSMVNTRPPPKARYTIGGSGDFRSRKMGNKGDTSRKSAQTFTSRTDTLDLLQALTTEFPGVPGTSNSSRRSLSGGIAPSLAEDSDAETITDAGHLSRSGSLVRSESGRTTNSTTNLIRRSSSRKRKPVPQYDEDELRGVRSPIQLSARDLTAQQQNPSVPPLPQNPLVRLPSSPRPGARRQAVKSQGQQPIPPSEQGSVLEFPWVQPGGDVVEDGKAELDDAWEKSGVGRIKSMGRVPRRWTPTPSHSEFSRESVVASWYEGPSDSNGSTYPTPPLSAVGNAV